MLDQMRSITGGRVCAAQVCGGLPLEGPVPNPLLLESSVEGEQLTITVNGSWTGERASELDQLSARPLPADRAIRRVDIDLHGLERLDMLGAWLLERMFRRFARGWPGRQVCRTAAALSQAV